MDVNTCIIGAGVIGLAIANKLSEKNDEIVILERNSGFGQETSSRNSEVIHSGIYYPTNSLKAKLCLRGNELMYAYCLHKDIAHNRCGKLVISQSEEEDAYLMQLREKGNQNGVAGIEWLGEYQIASIEPNIKAKNALLIPSTGIVDSHGLMKKLLEESLNRGVQIAYESNIQNIEKIHGGYKIKTLENGKNLFEFTAKKVINCAGLESDTLASLAGINNPDYKLNYCKGEYFRIHGSTKKMIQRLIYPIPFKNLQGLGIHATIELDGGLKLGPNIIYLDKNEYDYKVDPAHVDDFFAAASVYFPFLKRQDLLPEMSGIRPKLQTKGGPVRDFVIKHEKDAGYPGFINLIGIESPGLTASLAIAEYVSNQLY